MGYTCLGCGKEVDIDLRTAKKIICPFCGYRILRKPRPKVAKTVHAA
jgi:DNA-directed RNA polymerase subunit P